MGKPEDAPRWPVALWWHLRSCLGQNLTRDSLVSTSEGAGGHHDEDTVPSTSHDVGVPPLSAADELGVSTAPWKVSVGIPTFNRSTSLKKAAESVLAQDHPDIELIISDNASTDDTKVICNELAAGDSRVRYLRNDHNLGPTENFNLVRTAATGDYFMWLGDDDQIDQSYVRRCLEMLHRFPGTALATGRVAYLSQGDFQYWGRQVEPRAGRATARVIEYCQRVRDNGTFYGLCPRWVVEATDPMRNVMGGDLYLVASMAYLGPFRSVPDVTVHRATGGSTASLQNVARTAGLGRASIVLPQFVMVSQVFADVGWLNGTYRCLSRLRRLSLGASCAFVFFWRFVVLNGPGAIKRALILATSHEASKG